MNKTGHVHLPAFACNVSFNAKEFERACVMLADANIEFAKREATRKTGRMATTTTTPNRDAYRDAA